MLGMSDRDAEDVVVVTRVESGLQNELGDPECDYCFVYQR